MNDSLYKSHSCLSLITNASAKLPRPMSHVSSWRMRMTALAVPYTNFNQPITHHDHNVRMITQNVMLMALAHVAQMEVTPL